MQSVMSCQQKRSDEGESQCKSNAAKKTNWN